MEVGLQVRARVGDRCAFGLNAGSTYTIAEIKKEPVVRSTGWGQKDGPIYTFVRLEGSWQWFNSSLFEVV
ncbi:hypothetical protein C0580_02250 [Candidatus Parcubacteria bacterium]|nr:MAG: hypothetical protein C0580_02250 [Candidatus Parcubacteria bacterium]